MNPDNIIINERRYAQKVTYCMIQFHKIHRIGKSIETENKPVASRGWRKQGVGADCLIGTDEVAFGNDKIIPKLDNSDGCRTYDYTRNHWIIHYKRVNFIICELCLNKAVRKKESEIGEE